jgi:hypothetical protein
VPNSKMGPCIRGVHKSTIWFSPTYAFFEAYAGWRRSGGGKKRLGFNWDVEEGKAPPCTLAKSPISSSAAMAGTPSDRRVPNAAGTRPLLQSCAGTDTSTCGI